MRTLDVQSGLERYYQRFYLNLDREAFDRWLFASVNDRVQKYTSTTVKSLAEDSEGYAVTCENGVRLHGRFIARMEPTPWYGESCFRICPSNAIFPFSRFKERIRAFGYAQDSPLCREITLLLRPNAMPASGVLPNSKACLLGEAGGFISPSSAEGFSYAFRTVLALYLCKTRPSPAWPEFFAQVCRMHTQLLRPLRLVLWTKIIKQQILYNPLLRQGIMRSGIQALCRIEENHQ